jgi:hypothetical protein
VEEFCDELFGSVAQGISLSREWLKEVKFQVLTAASMKMVLFWVIMPCSLVEVFRRFRGACCLHHQGDE